MSFGLKGLREPQDTGKALVNDLKKKKIELFGHNLQHYVWRKNGEAYNSKPHWWFC